MSSSSSSLSSSSSSSKRKRDLNQDIFKSDIEEMLFGFGDAWPPKKETTQLVQNVVVQYIEDLVVRASEVGQLRGKLDAECFMFLVRKDQHKFSRVNGLLQTNEELKEAQKVTVADGAD